MIKSNAGRAFVTALAGAAALTIAGVAGATTAHAGPTAPGCWQQAAATEPGSYNQIGAIRPIARRRYRAGHQFTDPDGDTLTYSLSTPPDPVTGTVTVAASTGDWTYTPTLEARLKATDINATQSDRQVDFTISASDGVTSVPVAVTAPAAPLAIATIDVGTGPVGVAVSPDGTHLYVTDNDDATVSVINLE
jgi:hypothetical protein